MTAAARCYALQIREQPEQEREHGQLWMLEKKENGFSIPGFIKNQVLTLEFSPVHLVLYFYFVTGKE